MGLFESLKDLINRIEKLDIKARRMARNINYSSNPFAQFALKQNQTYVWVEKEQKSKQCKRKDFN